jgi:hypothetical protein
VKTFQLKQFFLFSLASLVIATPIARAQKLNPDDCVQLTSDYWDSEFLSPYRNLDRDIQKQFNRFHHQNDHNEIMFIVEDENITFEKISFGKNFSQKDVPIESALQKSLMRYHSQLERGRCYYGHFYHPNLLTQTANAGKEIKIPEKVSTAFGILILPITLPLAYLQYAVGMAVIRN